jgi:hypothetical protein
MFHVAHLKVSQDCEGKYSRVRDYGKDTIIGQTHTSEWKPHNSWKNQVILIES